MSMFDLAVLCVVGLMAVGGFSRGLVQEVITLASWVASMLAIRLLHLPVFGVFKGFISNEIAASMAAFIVLLAVPYFLTKYIAKKIGSKSRESLFGPIDQVLGFGFGAVKGALIIVIGFSIVVLGYDTIWGKEGRPEWMTQARTYPVISAGADAMVQVVAQKRAELKDEAEKKVEEKIKEKVLGG